MMDCTVARSLVDAWERGEIKDPEELLLLLGHLGDCPSCAALYTDLIPFIRREAEEAPPSSPSSAAIALADRVMTRIAAETIRPEPFWKTATRSIRHTTRPQRERFAWASHALGIAAAAALSIGLGLGLFFSLRDPYSRTIRFVLDAPNASSVAVAGDFNGWKTEGYELRPRGDGSWELKIRLRKDRVYAYNFVIDGERWIPDPSITESLDDGFGGSSSLLRL